jgi:Domain of unknown function (DUF5664)
MSKRKKKKTSKPNCVISATTITHNRGVSAELLEQYMSKIKSRKGKSIVEAKLQIYPYWKEALHNQIESGRKLNTDEVKTQAETSRKQKKIANIWEMTELVKINTPDFSDFRVITDDPIANSSIDPHVPGAKLDSGKARLSLVFGNFASALEAVGEVGTFGARKYTDNGWLTVPNGLERYTDALYRHLLAHARGEECDPESGLSHLAHVCWNSLAIAELTKRSKACPAPKD